MKRVPHWEKLLVPPPPTHLDVGDEYEQEAAIEIQNEEKVYPTFEATDSSCEHHLLTQGNLNYLVRDLDL